MDNADQVLRYLLCCLDDELFDVYAGLYNAQSLSGSLNASQELDLLRWVLYQEYERSRNPRVLALEQYIEQYL